MWLVPLVSLLGGGLAGGCVSTFLNRWFHWRDMRVKFYPVLTDMYSAYIIRMENPDGRYWVTVVGKVPSDEDKVFVNHRSNFLTDLIQFNELREARNLRRAILNNAMLGDHTEGATIRHDLASEREALSGCLRVLHKKLKID
jgi:hypothetical protein